MQTSAPQHKTELKAMPASNRLSRPKMHTTVKHKKKKLFGTNAHVVSLSHETYSQNCLRGGLK